jgi:putative PIN family toxin of toxin-antitoxin system
MTPKKVVIDTNVLISARLQPAGQPALIMNLAASRKIQMFISPEVWEEYEEVIYRPRFKLDPHVVKAVLEVIHNTSIMVEPKRKAHKASDKKDDRFLAAAAEAGAEYIITGNTKHFPAKYRKARIVTPSEFITIISPILGLPRPTNHALPHAPRR